MERYKTLPLDTVNETIVSNLKLNCLKRDSYNLGYIVSMMENGKSLDEIKNHLKSQEYEVK